MTARQFAFAFVFAASSFASLPAFAQRGGGGGGGGGGNGGGSGGAGCSRGSGAAGMTSNASFGSTIAQDPVAAQYAFRQLQQQQYMQQMMATRQQYMLRDMQQRQLMAQLQSQNANAKRTGNVKNSRGAADGVGSKQVAVR